MKTVFFALLFGTCGWLLFHEYLFATVLLGVPPPLARYPATVLVDTRITHRQIGATRKRRKSKQSRYGKPR